MHEVSSPSGRAMQRRRTDATAENEGKEREAKEGEEKRRGDIIIVFSPSLRIQLFFRPSLQPRDMMCVCLNVCVCRVMCTLRIYVGGDECTPH